LVGEKLFPANYDFERVKIIQYNFLGIT
jgi:hypothetical protein